MKIDEILKQIERQGKIVAGALNQTESRRKHIDEVLRSIVLRNMKDRYQADPNPLYAWQAYALCRERGMPVPEWVLKYLDTAVGDILQIQDDGKRVDHKIKAALRAKGDPIARDNQRSHELSVSWRVLSLMMADARANPNWTPKEDAYFVQVAEEAGVPKATVRRWFKKHHAYMLRP